MWGDPGERQELRRGVDPSYLVVNLLIPKGVWRPSIMFTQLCTTAFLYPRCRRSPQPTPDACVADVLPRVGLGGFPAPNADANSLHDEHVYCCNGEGTQVPHRHCPKNPPSNTMSGIDPNPLCCMILCFDYWKWSGVVEFPFWERLVTNNHHFAESFVVAMCELSWMSMRFAQQVAAVALPPLPP